MLAQAQFQRIGEVSKQSNLSVKTIRYYAESGLLRTIGRTEGGYRLFDADVFSHLKFIKRAQSLGLNLTEIKELLEIYNQNKLPCEFIKVKLENKLESIDQQIQQLQILKEELTELLSGWSDITEQREETVCPIIQ